MLECGMLLLIIAALVAGELTLWRWVGGKGWSRRGTVARATALGLLTASLVVYGSWRFSKARTVQLMGTIIPRVETTAPLVALTFDDGPSELVLETLDLLRAEGVHGTFFLIGQELEANMDVARRLVADGHELGNHTYSHPTMIGLSWGELTGQIERTDALIRAAGYPGEILFRPPGSKKLLLLPYYLASHGRKDILCDVEPESYPAIAHDADKIVAHVLEKARPGSIILLHVMYPSRAATRQALPGVIQGLRERGFGFVTVSELLAASS